MGPKWASSPVKLARLGGQSRLNGVREGGVQDASQGYNVVDTGHQLMGTEKEEESWERELGKINSLQVVSTERSGKLFIWPKIELRRAGWEMGIVKWPTHGQLKSGSAGVDSGKVHEEPRWINRNQHRGLKCSAQILKRTKNKGILGNKGRKRVKKWSGWLCHTHGHNHFNDTIYF